MFDYLAFVYGGISKSSGDAFKDGENLAGQCLHRLPLDRERFPPRLLMLLASPAYLEERKAGQLLRGISETFRQSHGKVELVGSSVAGVFFNRQIHPKGALLVCLASRLIEAKVAYGMRARQNPERAVSDLLKKLKLDPSKQIDPNPLANRLILTFMPGCSQSASNGGFYPAPTLHRLLYEGMQSRIWMIGGVSSANDLSRKKDGLQFANQQVLRDSVVAASIVTGVPIGVSLNDGLVSTNKILCATKLGKDKRIILKFNGLSPGEELSSVGGSPMLAKLSADDERTVDIPLRMDDGSVQLLRHAKLKDYFQVFRPGTEIIKTARKGIEQAKKRVYVNRPIASLLFPCKAYNPRNKGAISRAENALTEIENYLKNGPCVGGFFDGELGVDEKGRSRLTNGGVGYVIFGDEIRERTPLYKGVSALAKSGSKLLAGRKLIPDSIDETIRNALEILNETGFPGAMISLKVSNLHRRSQGKRRFIIGWEVVGERFKKIKEHTKRRCESDDILAVVANHKQAQFIPDSRKNRSCNQEAIRLSGLVSQYVLPLKRVDNTVFGTLQVDLGDLSHLSHEEFRGTEKARMLDCFAEVFSASINRIANAVENKIMLDLDKALEDSLSASSVHKGVDTFFKAAGKAFGIEMGHLRLAKTDGAPETRSGQKLVLVTGFGACYEVEKSGKRHEISSKERSPICCAFNSSSNEPQIVNNVNTDPVWRATLKRLSNDPELLGPLNQTASYAAIAFKSERGENLGALSFGSTKPWFFLTLHRKTLQVLAERLGFLIQHLKAKTARDFLLSVSPNLVEQNLNRTQGILRKVTEVFRRALDAKVASLYLWDDDRKKYILRAQSGWIDRRWEHAANYDEDSGWIGVEAINKEPLYVADLYNYYKKKKYDCPKGRYAQNMFGKDLSDDFTVEAIGLPLRIGPEKQDKFGVLTLYRPIEKGHPTGFVTTDIQLLQEGAYNAAGLVNAVLRHRDDMLVRDDEKRRRQVYQAIHSGDDNESFAAKVCRGMLRAFRAAEVEFYLIDGLDKTMNCSWVTGYRLLTGTNKLLKLAEPSVGNRQLIKRTVINRDDKQSYRVSTKRRRLMDEERADPTVVKTEGLVEKVCIPLTGDKKYLAALVVRWQLDPAQAFSRAARRSIRHLTTHGRIIGSAYSKHRIKKAERQGRQAVHTAGLYVFQHAHKLGNAVQVLYRIAQKIRSARNENERIVKATELEKEAEVYTETLNWFSDFGELIQNPAREPLYLRKFIRDSWGEVTLSSHPVDVFECTLDEDIIVRADPKLTKEVFINVMNNAVRALELKKEKTGEKTKLEVTATVSEDKETVEITFKDNGVGMTRRKINAAFRGFSSTGKTIRGIVHKGVGILISQYLLRVQDGGLAYKSKLGEGTEAFVTLPHFRLERRSK
jgi:hypothetical protein